MAWKSFGVTMFSTARWPTSSVAPKVWPPRIPPPASQIEKPWPLWSRPALASRFPSLTGRRPISPPQWTRVVSSRPRCLRSVTSAAAGLSVRRQMAGSAWRIDGVMVPRLAAQKELHEPDSALHQPAGDQAARAVLAGRVLVESVEPPDVRGLAGDVERFLGGRLHGRGQLEAVDPRFQVGFARMLRRGAGD